MCICPYYKHVYSTPLKWNNEVSLLEEISVWETGICMYILVISQDITVKAEVQYINNETVSTSLLNLRQFLKGGLTISTAIKQSACIASK